MGKYGKGIKYMRTNTSKISKDGLERKQYPAKNH